MERVNGLTFDQWKARVNRELVKMTTMVADDIGDCDYHSNWSGGVDPHEMARMAIEENGFDPDDFDTEEGESGTED